MTPGTPQFDAATERIIPSTRVCRVHLFRHPEVLGADERRCRGQQDVPLSNKGLREAAASATAWPGPYDRVFSSDLLRCRALADRLQTKVPVHSTQLLREQDMGEWDGLTWEELTRRDPDGTLAYWDDYVRARPPGGESYGDVYARVNGWWRDEDPVGTIAIVTHIGCIRALLCGWLGMGPAEALRWAPAYATHSEVLIADAGAVVVRFGEAPPTG